MNNNCHDTMTDLGLLALRLSAGGLMAGHGAQKLFGSFGGKGLAGTAGMLESIGLKPSKQWAALAGASEFGSGLLTALGLFSPLGPIAMFGPMVMASVTAHAGKPIWVTSGGPELPVAYMADATALALAGPGRFSLDNVLGVKIPGALVALTAAGVAAGLAIGISTRQHPSKGQPQAPNQAAATSSTAGASQLTPEPDKPADPEEPLKARESGASF